MQNIIDSVLTIASQQILRGFLQKSKVHPIGIKNCPAKQKVALSA